ncbi:MAG TPA: hypothetical protein VH437_20800 [Terriglobales bacterium]|jgi:uncharacterized membrane protein
MLTSLKPFFTLVLIPALTVAASATITWTTIDYPGASNTMVLGMNNRGDLVGCFACPGLAVHGFLFSNGIFTVVDFPGAKSTVAEGINDFGDIVGTYQLSDSDPTPRGFFLHNHVVESIRLPGWGSTSLHGINNNGDLVGDSLSNQAQFGFVRKGSVYYRFIFPLSVYTYARAINNAGDIAGYYTGGDLNAPAHGFVLRLGKSKRWKIIDAPGSETHINAVNDRRQLAGQVRQGLTLRGFALSYHDLMILRRTETDFVTATGMDNQANLVGYYYDTVNFRFHGFIRTR